jgi:single-stranded-DNA-specific exonuclease
MDKYCRPVVLIALKEETGRGSARSVAGIDIYESLAACRHYLSDLGGHAQAAGLKIAAGRVPDFREAFETVVSRRYGPESFVPMVFIDAVLNFKAIDSDLADQLETLMPFGAGNPEPLFAAHGVSAVFSAPAGAGHRRLVLTQPAISG